MDIKKGATFTFSFTTLVNGVPTALSGTPSISVYKDNNTTESTAGITLTASFDAKTGVNNVVIDTSADGTFYSAGSTFAAFISAGTVGGASVVGTVVESFSIEKAPVNWAQVAAPTTAVALTGTSVLISSGTGTGQLDVTSGVLKANLAQILGTALTETSLGRIVAAFKAFFDVATPVLTTASVNQTGDAYARLGAPAGASVSADVATANASLTTLTGRITSTLFSGITSMAQWLGALAGKQAADSTAQTEIRATGAGSGTFDPTTDSLEATRDSLTTSFNVAGVTLAAIDAKTTNLPASPAAVGSAMTLTSGERNSVADALLDRTDAIETGLTLREAQRLQTSAAAGTSTGAGGPVFTLRSAVSGAKDRIVVTVDGSGNRNAITLDTTDDQS